MSLYSNDSLRGAQFFVGVVEDRDDPEQLGRVRVRAFGIHTEDKDKIPTDTLPWATPVMPYTSASISGIGRSPTGPVEGTWVIGIFLDGGEMQQPAIIGTIVGNPVEPMDKTKGFSDPNGWYPIIEDENVVVKAIDDRGNATVEYTGEGESDVSRLARGDSIDSSTIDSLRPGEKVLAVKKKARYKEVPVAIPPTLDTVKDGAPPGKESKPHGRGYHVEPKTAPTLEEAGTIGFTPTMLEDSSSEPGESKWTDRLLWNEPTARYGGQNDDGAAPLNLDDVVRNNATPILPSKSKYPLNHVHVTESGHIFEADDSPDAERIHQYHTSGTFTEIQPNGTRVTKVVGDDYEIVMHDKNVVVSGNVNITVDGGDLRLYVKKDDDNKEKGGDMYIETDGDLNFNIKGDVNTKIGGTEHKEVISDSATNINGKNYLRVGKEMTQEVFGKHALFSFKDYSSVTTGTATMHGTVGYNIEAGIMSLSSMTALSITATTNLKLEAVVKADLVAGLINVGSPEALTTITSIYGNLEVDITSPVSVDINALRIDLN